MRKLTQQIKELASYARHTAHTNPAVSKSTVGWQIAHTLKVIQGIVHSLEQSTPADYQPKRSFFKTIILLTGIIPRGKARSPKVVLPDPEHLDEDALKAQITSAQQAVETLRTLPATAHFKHPIFGSLQKKTAIKFLKTHTEHHLKIIRDMMQ